MRSTQGRADFDLFEHENGGIAQVPGLLEGDVFSRVLIETWIAWKRENEVDLVRLRPHLAEFSLYYDC